MKTIYIAGKITGDENYVEKFLRKQKELQNKGWFVITPTLVKNPEWSYKDYIDAGLMLLSGCDAIYLLEDWFDSQGAQLELKYAETVGIDIFFEEDKGIDE